MTWFEPVFFILLIPLFIILAVTYARSKKVYPLLYILSVFAYINTVTYVMDAFNLQKNGILGLLVFSAILLIFVGVYVGKKK